MSDAGWGAPPPQADPWAQSAPQQPPAATGFQAPTAADMFGGVSVRSFSYAGDVAGVEHGGQIVEIPDPVQERDYHDPSKLLTWPDGKPKYTQPVICQTDYAKESEDDDQTRAFYLSYEKMKAVKEALKAVGKAMPEVGGWLYVRWHGMRGRTKLYSAVYAPPGSPNPRAGHAQPQGVPAANPFAPHAAQPDPWQGLNAPARAELQAKGLQPHQVLPHIQHRDGWQGAPASQILSVVPRPAPAPAPVEDKGWGGGYSDEPPF